MSTPHTPTPWRYHLGRGAAPKYHIQTAGGFQIASTPGSEPSHYANAEMILRAVNNHAELVSALDRLADASGIIGDLDHAGNPIDPARWAEMWAANCNARGVLAKAKGQP